MVALRRSLRLWTFAWLVFQVATLSALVSAECCESHRAAQKKAASCHQRVVKPHCPMRAADGAACPMHRGQGDASDRESEQGCAMGGTCSGPVAALVAMLANAGILPDAVQLDTNLLSQSTSETSPEQLVTRLAPPDSPPPRA